MALVNVAVELAQRGRRVLAVDFDLEAPGLDTFNLRRPDDKTPGMIDFVSAYLRSGQAPDASNFMFESHGMGDGGGGLWIMPAGAQHESYANTFAQINWGTLYDRHDGYLLFEDLKEQWKTSLEPDYVLIDSRTGHTDTGGICTRQLPDSVVILFFPNAQNLRGLTKVVYDIRSESNPPRNKKIDLHYVMSNVPDLDDEDKILKKSVASFQKELGFDSEPMVVHRYDSLSLLNQVIFTRERPNSRLSREYRSVTSGIMRLNAEDRDGALEYIKKRRMFAESDGDGRTRKEVDEHLKTVEKNHSNDGEVLYHLGMYRSSEGDMDGSNSLISRAIDAGYQEPEAYLMRATRRFLTLDTDGASQDAINVLHSDQASIQHVRRALQLIKNKDLTQFADSKAIVALDTTEQLRIAGSLNKSKAQAAIAGGIFRRVLATENLPAYSQEIVSHELPITDIALGRFSEAIEIIQNGVPDLDAMRIELAFNYGMALWGASRQVVPDPFHRVIELEHASPRENPGPNYLQCMAIAHWAIGEQEPALECANSAMEQMAARRAPEFEFSCWRYLAVGNAEFRRDTEEIVELISGNDNVTPLFMNASSS